MSKEYTVRDLQIATEVFREWVMTKAQGLALLAHITALEQRNAAPTIDESAFGKVEEIRRLHKHQRSELADAVPVLLAYISVLEEALREREGETCSG